MVAGGANSCANHQLRVHCSTDLGSLRESTAEADSTVWLATKHTGGAWIAATRRLSDSSSADKKVVGVVSLANRIRL